MVISKLSEEKAREEVEKTNEIVNKVVTRAKENDIILLHDCYKSSVQAALRIIDLLQSKGFEFVTVEELMLE